MLQKRSWKLSTNQLGRCLGGLRKVVPTFIVDIAIFLVYHLFVIRKIDCVYNGNPCPSEVLEKLPKYLGSNVLLLNQKSLSSSIKLSYPVDKITIGFKVFNTLKVKIDGRPSALKVQASLASTLPELSLDKTALSSESGNFSKPSEEIKTFSQTVSFISFDLWDTGLMTPTASSESKIKYLFTKKPDLETLKSVYTLIKLTEKYLDTRSITILNQRVFLSQVDQPDIIVNIPFEEEVLVQALQSFAYLTTIKKDAKVIDLRFKNPILR